MRKFYIIGFLILLCFDTTAQTSFKLAAMHAAPPGANLAWLVKLLQQPWLYGAVGSYIGAFITYMTLLKHAPIGPAFAATHMEIVTVLIVSVLFLGEHMSWLQVGGSLLIMGGIILLGTEKEEPPQDPEKMPANAH